jgi:hypothetical protein
MASVRQVLEFSRAFLGGSGDVVVIKIFMDETNTHEGARFLAVGAYMSRPEFWRAWTRDWNKAKRPIKVFHASDCANSFGEFKGWDAPKRDAFVANLLPVIPAHRLSGVVIGIDMIEFERVAAAHPEVAEMFGTPYSACFQWAISFLMDFATQYGTGERMAFVHEVNDYKEDALKAVSFVKCPSEDFLSPLNHLDSMEPILIRGRDFHVDAQEPAEIRPRSLEISERPD